MRLAFEAAGIPYTDVANEKEGGYAEVQRICMNKELDSADGNPPVFSPPALRISEGSTVLIISQTPNILVYLGDKIGLVPQTDADKYHAYQLMMTALDLNNEIHDTHHPIAAAQYYEDQSQEALRKAKDVREMRLPKFLSYFERSLKHNKNGRYLIGDQLSIADTTLWQVLDGTYFAFPKEMAVRKKEFPALLDQFYNSIKEEPPLKAYLSSKKRLQYSSGVFRHYPELDRQ